MRGRLPGALRGTRLNRPWAYRARKARIGVMLSAAPPLQSASVWFEGVLEGDRRKDVAGGVANEVDWASRQNPLLRRVG